MKISRAKIGQHFFQAAVYQNGRDIDDGSGDCFTSRDEANRDGLAMAAAHDPEWQKRNPDCVEHVTREFEVTSVCDSGEGIAGTNIGSAYTVD